MKVKHKGIEYEVDFFFGKSGEPKEKWDSTTPCVRTKCDKSFNVAECTFPDENRKKTIGFHKDTDEGFG